MTSINKGVLSKVLKKKKEIRLIIFLTLYFWDNAENEDLFSEDRDNVNFEGSAKNKKDVEKNKKV